MKKQLLIFACLCGILFSFSSCEKKDTKEEISTNIRFTDMNGSVIKEVDFGSSADLLAFNVYNDGAIKADCQMTYSCAWISSVSPITFSLAPGKIKMVTIQIDRSKLAAGQNTTNLYVSSNDDSNVLEIKATSSLSIYGTVIDADTQDPIQGAVLTLQPGGKSFYTGQDGSFEFKELEALMYTIMAQKDGYRTDRKNVNLGTGVNQEVTLALHKE